MILRNPKDGATIETITEGKVWRFPADSVWRFPDEVGKYFLKTFGFLEEIKEGQTELVEEGDLFRCSQCEYQSKTKVAVVQHIKGHKEQPVYQDAVPLKEAPKARTIYEVRRARQENFSGGLLDDSMVYGEGFEEKVPVTGLTEAKLRRSQ